MSKCAIPGCGRIAYSHGRLSYETPEPRYVQFPELCVEHCAERKSVLDILFADIPQVEK